MQYHLSLHARLGLEPEQHTPYLVLDANGSDLTSISTRSPIRHPPFFQWVCSVAPGSLQDTSSSSLGSEAGCSICEASCQKKRWDIRLVPGLFNDAPWNPASFSDGELRLPAMRFDSLGSIHWPSPEVGATDMYIGINRFSRAGSYISS